MTIMGVDLARFSLSVALATAVVGCAAVLGIGEPIIDPSEAGSRDSGSDVSDAGDVGLGPARRVFVTNKTYTGDLLPLEAPAGGPKGDGDAICTTAANTAGLGGTWHAWLQDADALLQRYPRPPVVYRLDGQKVFDGIGQLTPSVAINRDENNNQVTGNDNVWTGTRTDLKPACTCSNWTTRAAADNSGSVGSLGATTKDWTAKQCISCAATAHLYCFEE